MKSELAKRCAYDVLKCMNDLGCICIGALMGFYGSVLWQVWYESKNTAEKHEEQKPEDET